MQKNPLFSALLTPHRSLRPSGIHRVVALYAILAVIPAVYFLRTGAWPIVGFFGLDALALWWALSASLKSGRAFEEVTLWPDSLEIRHVNPLGAARAHAFNPFFVRLDVSRDFDDRVTKLILRNRGETLEIGAFLNPDDKASFASVFGQALKTARV